MRAPTSRRDKTPFHGMGGGNDAGHMKELTREGLLVSQRGTRGGYSLARRPEEISVAEVIAALEGPIALTECSAHPGVCQQESSCHVRSPWQRINRTIHETLEGIRLSDLMPGSEPGTLVPLSLIGNGASDAGGSS